MLPADRDGHAMRTLLAQLARTVAENIFAIDTKFWIRLATRNDTAQSAADKERLQSLANSVMVLVNALVKQSEQQLQGGSQVLQDILVAAADANGEWYLPLSDEQVRSCTRLGGRHTLSLCTCGGAF